MTYILKHPYRLEMYLKEIPSRMVLILTQISLPSSSNTSANDKDDTNTKETRQHQHPKAPNCVLCVIRVPLVNYRTRALLLLC